MTALKVTAVSCLSEKERVWEDLVDEDWKWAGPEVNFVVETVGNVFPDNEK